MRCHSHLEILSHPYTIDRFKQDYPKITPLYYVRLRKFSMGWQGYQYIGFEWAMFALSCLFVANRLYVQLRQLRTKLKIYREAIVVIAWIGFLAQAIMESYLCNYNFDNESSDPFYAQPVNVQIRALKILFAEAFVYLPSIYLCKVELLLLYHDLAPRHHYPKIFWLILATWFLVVAGFLVQVLYLFLACIPFDLNWALPQAACGITRAYFLSVWSTHIASDIFVYLVPIVIISRLQSFTFSKKLGAAAMFVVGFVNVFAAIFIMVTVTWDQNTSWAWYGAQTFMQSAQVATAIWIICAPQLSTTWKLLRKKGTGNSVTAYNVEKPDRRKVKDIESVLITRNTTSDQGTGESLSKKASNALEALESGSENVSHTNISK